MIEPYCLEGTLVNLGTQRPNETPNVHNVQNPQSDPTTVKLEPYSNNTLMNIDSENADSRLITFKDGFNFEENYQEWSTNVSRILFINFSVTDILFLSMHICFCFHD